MKRTLQLITQGYDRIKLRKMSTVTLGSFYKPSIHMKQFGNFPLEIKYKIFSYLEISDMCNLCRTCESFRVLIEGYVESSFSTLTRQFNKPHENFGKQKKSGAQFRDIGKLYKEIKIGCPLPMQLNFLSLLLKKHLCFNVSIDSSIKNGDNIFCCKSLQSCQSMTYYGYFLSGFITDFKDNELRRLFQTLIQFCFETNFWKKLTRLLFKTPGCDTEEELKVRLFLRRLFLNPDCDMDCLGDPWNLSPKDVHTEVVKFVNEDEIEKYELSIGTRSSLMIRKAGVHPFSKDKHGNHAKHQRNYLTFLWLNEILKSYSIGHQAKVLFILYGPLHRDRLMWGAMCENTAADASQVSACFGELGWAMRLLQAEHCWTDLDTIAALGEMTRAPDEWLAENIACLLYTAGYAIATQYIRHKTTEGLSSEVAIVLTSLCLVQVKLGTDFRNVLALVDEACSAAGTMRDRRVLLDKLAVSFQEVIVDLYASDEIDNRLDDFSTLLKAQASFVRAMFRRIYED